MESESSYACWCCPPHAPVLHQGRSYHHVVNCRNDQAPVPWPCWWPGIRARTCNCQLRHWLCADTQGHVPCCWHCCGHLLPARGGEERRTQRLLSHNCTGHMLPASMLHTLTTAVQNLFRMREQSKPKGPTLTLLNRFKKLHICFDLKEDRKS